jgi:tetratricopeptide (TPR) repeat protein
MKRLLLALLLVAAAGRADDFSTAVASMEKGWMNDDAAAIRASMETLKAMHAAAPKARIAYAAGYAARRLAYMRGTPAADQMALLTEAIARFEAVIALEPKNAEGRALLASALGGMIGLDRGMAIELGPRSGQEMQKALALEPNNPRVLLLAGISALRKPAEYGGGADVAEPLLRRAAQIFGQEPADRPWPNWGRFESHVWLGQILDKLGKKDDARTEYEKALALAPRSGWARAILQARNKS